MLSMVDWKEMDSHRLLAGVKLVQTLYSVVGSNVFHSEIPLLKFFFNNHRDS